ncbi:MAG: winged helix family transcriptional regulator, partial [Acidimicrobiales bacterium]
VRRGTVIEDDSTTLQVGDMTLDLDRREVTRDGHNIDLTKTEFELLALLMHNEGIVLTREVIYERIWGYDFETNSKSLDVYIGYLRRKTEEHGGSRLVHTVRGVGYTARDQ